MKIAATTVAMRTHHLLGKEVGKGGGSLETVKGKRIGVMGEWVEEQSSRSLGCRLHSPFKQECRVIWLGIYLTY